jgi:lysophospholipase L1-like esterase
MRLPLLLAGIVAAALLGAGGCTAWRIGEARALAQQSTPLQHTPADATLRMLIVGDSTGVGTGASAPLASLAGLLAQDYPRLWIENRSRDGATFAGTAEQLARDGSFDIVLVFAGGNDVIRLRAADALRADIERTVLLARERAEVVVLMPAGNVGNAPFFLPPLSWELTRRARLLHDMVRDVAQRRGVTYVNLFHERDDDPFVQRPELHACDGLHPSDAGYLEWYQTLLLQADLAERLSAARAIDSPAPRRSSHNTSRAAGLTDLDGGGAPGASLIVAGAWPSISSLAALYLETY